MSSLECPASVRAIVQKTYRCTYLTSKPSARNCSVQLERRLTSRARRDVGSAGNKRQTCPYAVAAGALARRDQGAMFSMAIRTAQVDRVQDMLENGTKHPSVDEPGALVLSFAACKAQEAQDALHSATQHYAVHADAEARVFLEDAKEHQQASLEIMSLLLSHSANSEEVYTPGDGTSIQFRYKPRRLLHQAVIWNNAAMAELLLSYDADQNARDFNGWSPLHYAASHNCVATAEALVARGAAVSFRDNNNSTPLHFAATADSLEVCKLLLFHGARKNAQDQSGDTPLHAAAQHAGVALVKLLLGKGCNPVAENLLGKVPSDLAHRPGNEEVMRLLVAACIDWQIATSR